MARITKKTQMAVERAEKAELQRRNSAARKSGSLRSKTKDAYQNFPLNIGVGTDNALSGSTYGFNPITRNRTLLEWMQRGSWLARMAVDLVADDMTRAGIDITCDATPEDIQGVQNDLVSLGVWTGLRDAIANGRLYGGGIAVVMIDGQDYEKEFKPERVGKGQFRGIMPLDRWQVEPSLNDLVTEQGPYLGLPKFYRVTSDVPGMRMKKIHYTRCIRLIGGWLPYQQRVSENLWGVSVLEPLYDRMIAFDSATMGAAQLAYKSYLRTIKIKGLRSIITTGGPALEGLYQFVEAMRKYQGIEGVTMLDGEDEFVPHSGGNFAGLSDVMLQMGQQVSGALQIPLVRMFGQSPAGLNSTGESDLRTYYDGIKQKQNNDLLIGVKTAVFAAARSGGWKIPDDAHVSFTPLWQLSEEQKSEVADRDASSVIAVEAAGLVGQKTAMKELKERSKTTGRFTNITDEEIKLASDELAPRGQEAIDQETAAMSDRAETVGDKGDDEDSNDPKNMKTRDVSLPISELFGLPIAIENQKGTLRRGADEEGNRWSSPMPADYGYIRRAPSAEGEREWMDCFVGDIRDRECRAYVIDGYTPIGMFDEHKVMLGFPDARSAMQCFHEAYADGRRAGSVTEMSHDDLREWLASGEVLRPLGRRNLRLASGDARAA